MRRVCVRDSRGRPVLHSAARGDLRQLEERLLRVGSHWVRRQEGLRGRMQRQVHANVVAGEERRGKGRRRGARSRLRRRRGVNSKVVLLFFACAPPLCFLSGDQSKPHSQKQYLLQFTLRFHSEI